MYPHLGQVTTRLPPEIRYSSSTWVLASRHRLPVRPFIAVELATPRRCPYLDRITTLLRGRISTKLTRHNVITQARRRAQGITQGSLTIRPSLPWKLRARWLIVLTISLAEAAAPYGHSTLSYVRGGPRRQHAWKHVYTLGQTPITHTHFLTHRRLGESTSPL